MPTSTLPRDGQVHVSLPLCHCDELGHAATHLRMLPDLVPTLQPRQVTDCPMCGYTWPACGCRI